MLRRWEVGKRTKCFRAEFDFIMVFRIFLERVFVWPLTLDIFTRVIENNR